MQLGVVAHMAAGDHQMGKAQDILPAVPAVKAQQHIAADGEIKLCAGGSCRQHLQREDGVVPLSQRSLLHLPDYVFPAVMLVFGWPTQQQKDRPKPQRCAMEHIVHENGYRTMDGAELRDTFGYKAGNAPFDQWCTAFCNRKYNSDFSKEMTRSVEEYLGQFR